MPFLLVIGAAYACYSKNDGDGAKPKSNAIKIDRSINLRGKTVLDLHSLEKELSMMELPISVLSCFDGNYTNVTIFLEQRVNEIIRCNPWLSGVLLPMPDVKLIYDQKGKDRPPAMFRVYEPGVIDFHSTTNYSAYSQVLKDVLVCNNAELIGQNKPLWKVSLIPDAKTPLAKFALVVSMSHAIGDAHTFYAIYNMLSATHHVQALNPRRVSHYVETVHRTLGATEVNFVHSLTHHSHASEHVALSATKSFDTSGQQLDQSDSSDPTESTTPTDDDPPESSSSLIRSMIQLQAETHAPKNVMKLFYVNDAWLVQHKEQHDAGHDTVSTNSILSSWFVRLNQSTVGVLMVNLRPRLMRDSDGLLLTDMDAGNYAHAVVGEGATDFDTPQQVHDLVQRLGRVDTNVSLDATGDFHADRTASLCVNWTNFYRKELVLSDDCTTQRHLPIYDTTTLQCLPDKVSAINLFTSQCANGNDKSHRIGAFVICQEAVWQQIEASGIVDGMIL